MRHLLKQAIGLALSSALALGLHSAAKAEPGVSSDAAPTQEEASAQSGLASQDPLIIGRNVLTHADRTGLAKFAVSWANWSLLSDDESPYFCDEKQKGPIWYLDRGASTVQPCKIPANKYIMIPVAYAWQAVGQTSQYLAPEDSDEIVHTPQGDIPIGDKKLSCREAIDTVKGWTDSLLVSGEYPAEPWFQTKFMLDGQRIEDFQPFRVSFNKCLPSPNCGDAPFALDGYWVLLPPLPPGHHIIFTAYWDPNADCDGVREQLYEIEVQPEEKTAAQQLSALDAHLSDKVHLNKYAKAEFFLTPGKDIFTQYQGQSLTDLAVAWTEQMLKTDWFKADKNKRNNGNICYGHSGDSLWYLKDVKEGNCNIPENAYLAVPLDYKFQYALSEEPEDCTIAKEEIESWINDSNNRSALSVDGKILRDLSAFRVSLDICPLAPQDSRKYPGRPYAIGGYWAVLPPLGKGYHEICVGRHCASLNADTPYSDPDSVQLYHISVE